MSPLCEHILYSTEAENLDSLTVTPNLTGN